MSRIVKTVEDLKNKHGQDNLVFLFMPEQDYYMAIKEDAVKVSSILGTTLTKSNGYEMTGFEKSNYDNYIKRLLRAKHSVLIAEPLNEKDDE